MTTTTTTTTTTTITTTTATTTTMTTTTTTTSPRYLAFSSAVWKRPCPNFDDVSMKLKLISSRAKIDVLGRIDLRRVTTRFLGPTMPPLRSNQSLVTTP